MAKDVFEPGVRRLESTEHEFRRLDSDGSGALSHDEVKEGLRQRGLPASKEAIGGFFAKADLNGDGKISIEEYRTFVRERIAELQEVYTSVDANGDGRLTTDELRRAAQRLGFSVSAEQLRRVQEVADRDHDGAVSFDEFVTFLLLLPTVNPAAVFEAFASLYIESASSEYAPPAEVVGDFERAQLITVLLSKVYSGSIAGGVSRTLTAPIDRLKTLMQAAPPGQAGGGLVDGMRAIYREGGLPAFFRGNSVNVMKIAPETSLKFVAFDQLKGSVAKDRDNVTVGERLVAGGAAGAIAQAAIYPLEITKTRMAVSAPGVYSGIADCLRKIVRGEGAGALYQGLSTSLVGIVPYAGIDLAMNSVLKDMATRIYKARDAEPSVFAVLACGMVSSTTAMLATYPLNLVRTRLQASGMPGSPTYAGPLDCFRQTVQAGGLRALYQGIVPNMLKVLPATSISYAVYDMLSK